MKNKFLIIFSGIIISLLFTSHCFALIAPSNLSVPEETIGEGSAILFWYWEDTGSIKQFKLLWREVTEFSDEDWLVKYPSATGGPDYSYSLRGLEAGTSYEWRIKAEAPDPSDDSAYTDGPLPPFTTDESVFVPDDGETSIDILSPFENIGTLKEAVDALMEFLAITGFAVGPILIIYAAFLLLTKQGDPAAVTQAKQIILWTIVALSIILFAKGIPAVVKDMFQ